MCGQLTATCQDRNNRVPYEANSVPVANERENNGTLEQIEHNDCKLSNETALTDRRNNATDPLTFTGRTTCRIISHEKMIHNRYNNLKSDDISNVSVAVVTTGSCTNPTKTVLAPIRDPLTNEITNTLVPVEVLDNSGTNIIKNVLIPVRGENGSMSYDVRRVVVPIKPEHNFPRRRRTSHKLATSTGPSIQVKIVSNEDRQSEPREDARINVSPEETERIIESIAQEPTEEACQEKICNPIYSFITKTMEMDEKRSRTTPETVEPPKEEVDRILDNLKNICPVCQKYFENEKKMQRHVNRFHNKTHNCDKCDKRYYSKAGLETHVKVHQDDFYLECSICRLRYKRKAGLRHHVIRAHNTAEPKYICDYCGKGFYLKMDIGVHIEFTHMNVTHICRICGKAAKNIRNHEYLHERRLRKINCQYRCHLCNKRFSTSNNLENHLLMHKDGFKCDRCNEVFSRPSELTRHKNVKHRPGSLCTICDKMFHCKSNFYQHVLTHDGVRPYKCDICREDFTQRSSLLRHRRTHSGPLPPFMGIAHIADIAKKILLKYSRD